MDEMCKMAYFISFILYGCAVFVNFLGCAEDAVKVSLAPASKDK